MKTTVSQQAVENEEIESNWIIPFPSQQPARMEQTIHEGNKSALFFFLNHVYKSALLNNGHGDTTLWKIL